MTGWQPIETVPRDGTLVDLWLRSYFWNADGERQVAVEFRVPDAEWYMGEWTNEDGNPLDQLDGFSDYEFTHWMPRPEGPKE